MSTFSSRSSLGVASNRKDPSWRSFSLSKNSIPASLSYVTAEPEQGSPLASATSKLPAQIGSGPGAGNVIELIITNDSGGGHSDTLQDARSAASVVDPLLPQPNTQSSRLGVVSESQSPSRRTTTRDNHLSGMTFKERKMGGRRSSAPNGWLISATRPKGKVEVAAQPVPVTADSLFATADSKPSDVNASSPVASSSKHQASISTPPAPPVASSTNHQASASISSRNNIPPLPPTCDCSEAPGPRSTTDATRQPSTLPAPRQADGTSQPLTTYTSVPPNPTSEVDPGPGTFSKKQEQVPKNGNIYPNLDKATNVSSEALSKAADSAANRSWLGTWFGWSSPTSTHGTNATDSNSDVHRTDHDRQDPRHENETPETKSNSTQQADSTDVGNTNATMLCETDGDKYQSLSQDDNQPSKRAGELAVTPTDDAPTFSVSPNSHDAPNPTTDSDAIVPGSPSAGKDAIQSTSQPPETESRASWWDYIGWRSSPTVPPSSTTCVPGIPLQNGKSSALVLSVSRLDSVDIANNSQDKASSQPLTCDIPAGGTLNGKGVSDKMTPGGKLPAVVLSPSTSASTEIVSVASSGSEDQQHLIPPPGPEQGQQGSDQEAKKQDQGQDQVHVDSTDGGAGGAWYTPWTWYGYSYGSYADKGSSADAGKRDAVLTEYGENIKGEKLGTTERETETTIDDERPVSSQNDSERQKEPELRVTVHGPPILPPPASAIEINPIAATIDTHRSSWISFFASRTSRTLVTKSITAPSGSDASTADGGTSPAKVDENGMEIMDIEDDGAPHSYQPSPTQDQVDTSKAKETKELRATSASDVIPPSQGLVATLVRGRGKVRGQPRTTTEYDNAKDGYSDVSSIRSIVQNSGTATPAVVHSGAASPPRPDQDGSAAAAGSLPSSPSSTTSLVKKASLNLTASTTKPVDGTKKSRSPKPVSPVPSPTSSKKAIAPPPPNLILPTWQDTFHTAPRNIVPRPEAGVLAKTMQYVSGILFSGGGTRFGPSSTSGQGSVDKGKRRASNETGERVHELVNFGKVLPRAWDILDTAHADVQLDKDVLRGCKRVVVIGVHGWFPGAVMRTVIGEPTGTSSKFANMMVQALEEFQDEHDVELEKITKIPLEGEGTIKQRVEKLYSNLLANQEWISDIHAADAILVATHSQGSVVSTHLLDRLIGDKHIRTARNRVVGPSGSPSAAAGTDTATLPKPQKVCCLAMCGIHLGPLRYLNTTTLLQPYFQYLESPAARELFEFQNTDNEVSKEYVKALRNVLNNGVKMVYVASLNDQVVPIYSGVFTAASHPLILRALYIDGDAYYSSDFLAYLLVLLLRILNSNISDSGLLTHLSEATAGSLNGVGHSKAYEEVATYALAVKYLFLTNNGLEEHPDLLLEPFNARQEQNDYEIPWALRDVIADERVAHFFLKEIIKLRDAFREWHPRTSILRDLKRKLQPIQRLPASFAASRL
ncbi:hypothetical protein AX15_002364 [Amanita polypyramis BW_CC]|nr:hypothetical protein AX15_002364 [Amanita polypyramis BW_CC]